MAEAGIEVIHDSGRSVPAAPYLSYLVSGDPTAGEPVMPGLRFPIRSRLHPGLLDQARAVFDPLWLSQPVFVVGADARSLRWLSFNRYRLLRAGAWGLVVQARDADDFRAIASIAPDLSLAPSEGNWFDGRLIAAGVTVYPLLIDLDGLARQILPDAYGAPDVPFAAPVRAASRTEQQP